MADTKGKTPRKRLSDEQRVSALRARLEAAQARLSKKRRNDDARAMILFGRCIEHLCDQDRQRAEWFAKEMRAFMSRDVDREVVEPVLARLLAPPSAPTPVAAAKPTPPQVHVAGSLGPTSAPRPTPAPSTMPVAGSLPAELQWFDPNTKR